MNKIKIKGDIIMSEKKSTCKYAEKHCYSGYCECSRDGSIRRDPCHCKHYKKSWFKRFVEFLCNITT